MYSKKSQSMTDLRIVLDLDSTLVHSSINMQAFENLRIYSNPSNVSLRERVYQFELVDASDNPGSGVKTHMWGVFRPHLREFVNFMCLYFKEVYIYSAGLYKYVHAVNDAIFSQTPCQPVLIYSRDDCNGYQGDLVKPLTKVYNDPHTHGANETNTFVLDDRDKTFCLNHHNGIKIPIYEPNATLQDVMADDVCLLQLMYWLSLPDVMQCKDVRNLDKSYIFTTPITTYQSMLNPNFTSIYNQASSLQNNINLGGLIRYGQTPVGITTT